MANKLFPKFKEALLKKKIDVTADTIKVALVGAGYTYSASHEFYSDITPGSNTIGTPQAISGKSATNGIFDGSSPLVFTAVTGAQVTQLVAYQDTGTAATSYVMVHIDTATGLAVTPNGGDIQISFDTGASKIFSL